MNSTQIKSEETELLVLNLSLGSELVPSYLTKIPFDHVILEDRQSVLLLLPYSSCRPHKKPYLFAKSFNLATPTFTMRRLRGLLLVFVCGFLSVSCVSV